MYLLISSFSKYFNSFLWLLTSIGLLYTDEFFSDAVHRIEYGRFTDRVNRLNLLINPLSDSAENEIFFYKDQKDCVFTVPVILANSQFFMENLWQCVLEYVKDTHRIRRVLIGGDGRLLNQYASEILVRVVSANSKEDANIKTVVAKNGVLTSQMAATYMGSNGDDIAIVLTAKGRPGGVKNGYFGVNILTGQDPNTEARSLNTAQWMEIIHRMKSQSSVWISRERVKMDTIPEVDVFSAYLDQICAFFDLSKIKDFVASSGLLVCVDCMAGVASEILKAPISTSKQMEFEMKRYPYIEHSGKMDYFCLLKVLQIRIFPAF